MKKKTDIIEIRKMEGCDKRDNVDSIWIKICVIILIYFVCLFIIIRIT